MASLEGSPGPSAPSPEGSGLTLMRLRVWTKDARLKMRLMSLMVDDCRGQLRCRLYCSTRSALLTAPIPFRVACSTVARGGALVSLIHAYTENGDPFARGFTDEVLEEVSVYLSITRPPLTFNWRRLTDGYRFGMTSPYRSQNPSLTLYSAGFSTESYTTLIQSSSSASTLISPTHSSSGYDRSLVPRTQASRMVSEEVGDGREGLV